MSGTSANLCGLPASHASENTNMIFRRDVLSRLSVQRRKFLQDSFDEKGIGHLGNISRWIDDAVVAFLIEFKYQRPPVDAYMELMDETDLDEPCGQFVLRSL